MMKKLAFIFLLLAPLCAIQNVYADTVANCVFANTMSLVGTKTMTIPLLAGNITVGPDLPNGTVVYRQAYSFSGSMVDITCNDRLPFTIERTLTSTPLALSSWSGTPYPGKVYETGVPGLGVAIDYSYPPTAFPFSTASCAATVRCSVGGGFFDFGLVIIKTGDVTAGTISGSSLPCAGQDVGQAGGLVPITRSCFSGALNVVARTCTTPGDIPVRLGTHYISEFNGAGSATSWVDASIRLTNCPVFYGTYGNTDSTYPGSTPPGWSDDGSQTSGAPSANVVFLQLSPTTKVIDSNNFIFALDNTAGDAASGIGIQVLRGTASAQLTTWPRYYYNYLMSSGQGSNITIPIVARYIQTASSTEEMQPGLANGKVVYTISYQ